MVRALNRAAGRAAAWGCLLWKWTVSPLLGSNCRFAPSCSEYAAEAFRRHGALRGLYLTCRRVCRCNSLCAGGVDLVPAEEPGASRRPCSSDPSPALPAASPHAARVRIDGTSRRHNLVS